MSRKSTFIIIGSAVAIVLVMVLWVIARWTGIIQSYHASTSSNEPTISTGSIVLGSNLKAPAQGAFIFYRPNNSSTNEIYVHRLCAVGGDRLVIKKGIVYVNGKSFDQHLNLKHSYRIATGTALALKEKGIIGASDLSYRSGETTIVFMEDQLVTTRNLSAQRNITSKTELDGAIQNIYGKNWNKDNFGPLVIPKDHYFVLGDNRDNALDSRYTGLIPRQQWVGTKFE
jgi:signal peptidase I